MPTLRELSQIIATDLGYTIDDSRELFAVMFNVQAAINKLNHIEIKAAQKKGDDVSVASMAQHFVVDVAYNTPANDSDWPYHYFILPSQIYTLPHDGAVAYIRYNRIDLPANCPPSVAGATFSPTTLAALNGLYGSRMQRPSPSRPYYERGRQMVNGVMRDHVRLYGVSPLIRKLNVGLYASLPTDTVALANLADQPVDLSPEALRALKRMVLDDEAWILNIPQERLRNDGRDFEPGQVVRTPRQTSINDPVNSVDIE